MMRKCCEGSKRLGAGLILVLAVMNGTESWAQIEKASPAEQVLKPSGDSLDFTVVEAISGDRLTVDTGETIRLLGVAAPEPAGPSSPADYFAAEAAKRLNERVKGQEVTVTFSKRKSDSSGIWLGLVWLKGDVLLNEVAVREGWALADPGPNLEEIYTEALLDAEKTARETKAGMWESPGKASRLADRFATRNQGIPTENQNATAPPPLGLKPPPPGGLNRVGAPSGSPGSQARSRVVPQTRIYQQPVRISPGLPLVGSGSSLGNNSLYALPPATGASDSKASTTSRSQASKRTEGRYNINHGPDGSIIGLTPSQRGNSSKFFFSPTQPGLSNKPTKK